MSGVAAVWYKLKTAAGVLALVPADRIKAGTLPLKIALPAIAVSEISSVERLTVGMNEAGRLRIDRVQVSVYAKTYPLKKQLLQAVRDALPLTKGTVNGVRVESLLPDIIGPDLDDMAAEIFEQSQDFIVGWHDV